MTDQVKTIDSETFIKDKFIPLHNDISDCVRRIQALSRVLANAATGDSLVGEDHLQVLADLIGDYADQIEKALDATVI